MMPSFRIGCPSSVTATAPADLQRGIIVDRFALEIARHPKATRDLDIGKVDDIIDLIAHTMRKPKANERKAVAIYALMVGTLQLARASNDSGCPARFCRAGPREAVALAGQAGGPGAEVRSSLREGPVPRLRTSSSVGCARPPPGGSRSNTEAILARSRSRAVCGQWVAELHSICLSFSPAATSRGGSAADHASSSGVSMFRMPGNADLASYWLASLPK